MQMQFTQVLTAKITKDVYYQKLFTNTLYYCIHKCEFIHKSEKIKKNIVLILSNTHFYIEEHTGIKDTDHPFQIFFFKRSFKIFETMCLKD